MTSLWFAVRGAALALLLVVAMACGDDSTPTTPSNTSSSKSEGWSSVVAPGGQSTHTFTVNNSGTITITMKSAGATLGVGVGLPRLTGGGCRLGVTMQATSGSQLSTSADAGGYCVQVYDLGTLRDPVPFELQIDRP